jgi:hypothetical protein
MRDGATNRWGLRLVGPLMVVLGFGQVVALGDEPSVGSRLGRLFRLGGSSTQPAPSQPAAGPAAYPTPTYGATPSLIPAPATPALPAGDNAPRIVPQPRVSQAATDADPLVTRIAIGRSDNGSHFGMFMQVFADGTVVDGEGIHHVGREVLKPLAEALRSPELFRAHGHCGGPATDFIEQVHMVVYERNLGRLRANSFTFSGNTAGCDHSVRHIQAALDTIQQKLSSSAPASFATPAGPLPPPSDQPTPPTTGGRAIPLTPIN